MSPSSVRAHPEGYRYALNPIQFFATEDGWLDMTRGPQGEALFGAVRTAGFGALPVLVPEGWTLAHYRAALRDAGLVLAPGYVSVSLPDDPAHLPRVLEAVRIAADQHAGLDVPAMFLAARMVRGAPRILTPAVGAVADEARLSALVDLVGHAAEVMRSAGVRALLHPHVGTWIETEAETRRVLDAVGAGTLGFGPDTGHLSWAGADVVGLLADYRDRVGAVHVKDARLDVARESRAAGHGYSQTVLAGLWTEPGLGSIDLVGMIAALGPDFDGWLIAEVDYPTMDPIDSARVSAEWLAALRRPGSRAQT
jgi:inosose dehydratase